MAYQGIVARNEGQKKAIRCLANKKPFLFLTGPAGTGKSLITIAVGLHQVLEEQDFSQFAYTRMQVAMGRDLGFLPGDLKEKTEPFYQPFLDNFEKLEYTAGLDHLQRGTKPKLKFETIQLMRGRSLSDKFIFIDEAQNLDKETITGLATRVAEDEFEGRFSKMVFCGNFAQIDDESLRKPEDNGMFELLRRMYQHNGYEYFDHINLTQVERSKAAAFVEKIMRDSIMDPRFEALEMKGNVI